ncbi:cytochrome b [Aurantiacibacter spongiae]|uniref:Cytochrome b n=1 Tax=Aurantiacibacter spongiae TaxID=2488860 RepID=A0A3N5DNB2_9SPHN|nr:cytochrome b [Aurantiacibacter spongiae]RPF72415.1 cytochrome b [Aurantiacibacter spongiae]
MTDATTKSRYSLGAMIFHWAIAIAVIWNWRLAETAHETADRAHGAALMADHKALGITILALTLGRIAWRLTHKLPPLPANYATWERVLARGTHLIFYILLVALPLAGWIANSLGGKMIDYFGLFTIPALPVGQNGDLGHSIFEVHATTGTIMIWLIGLHILGALKHTFFDKDGGIFRMLPFGSVGAERR